ncbi:MAG: aspartate aminotransferase family protein [Dehalococcoidia bacterium]
MLSSTNVSNSTHETDLLRRARAAIAGGSLSTGALPEEIGFVVASAKGAHLFSTAGREYIDYVIGSGPMLLGHGHPEVVAAVQEQAARGSTFFMINPQAIELAERLVAAIPCAEQVKFVGTGSEATFGALRLARAYTGREKIMKLEGGYHGNHDYGLMSVTPADPPPYPAPAPEAAGIPAAVRDTVLIAPFNDLETAQDLIIEHREELAAVIVEPLQRALPPQPGFLAGLKEACRRSGALLIFDEVVTGFRLAWGGAQERYGVVPDLATYGKVIGGGYPLAAICGPKAIMRAADPAEGRNGAGLTGTLSGNPVSAAAGIATLRVLEREQERIYPHLYDFGERLRRGMAARFVAHHIPAQAVGEGPVFQIYLQERPIRDYRDTLAADGGRWRQFCNEMTRRGIFLNGGKVYCSVAHSDDDLRRTLEVCDQALDAMTGMGNRQ